MEAGGPRRSPSRASGSRREAEEGEEWEEEDWKEKEEWKEESAAAKRGRMNWKKMGREGRGARILGIGRRDKNNARGSAPPFSPSCGPAEAARRCSCEGQRGGGRCAQVKRSLQCNMPYLDRCTSRRSESSAACLRLC